MPSLQRMLVQTSTSDVVLLIAHIHKRTSFDALTLSTCTPSIVPSTKTRFHRSCQKKKQKAHHDRLFLALAAGIILHTVGAKAREEEWWAFVENKPKILGDTLLFNSRYAYIAYLIWVNAQGVNTHILFFENLHPSALSYMPVRRYCFTRPWMDA